MTTIEIKEKAKKPKKPKSTVRYNIYVPIRYMKGEADIYRYGVRIASREGRVVFGTERAIQP